MYLLFIKTYVKVKEYKVLTYNASLKCCCGIFCRWAYIVIGNNICLCSWHILLLATIYVYVHGTFCCWQQYMSMFMAHFVAGNNICLCSWHILLLATIYVYVHGTFCCWQQYICQDCSTYCHPSAHIVTGDDICHNSCVCLVGRGETDKQRERETDRAYSEANTVL